MEALRTPTDVWEAGGHIWEVVRTQGSRLECPEGRRQSETGLRAAETVRRFTGGFESDSPAPEGRSWSRSVPGRPVGLYM